MKRVLWLQESTFYQYWDWTVFTDILSSAQDFNGFLIFMGLRWACIARRSRTEALPGNLQILVDLVRNYQSLAEVKIKV